MAAQKVISKQQCKNLSFFFKLKFAYSFGVFMLSAKILSSLFGKLSSSKASAIGTVQICA